MRFLLSWQHVGPGPSAPRVRWRRRGRRAAAGLRGGGRRLGVGDPAGPGGRLPRPPFSTSGAPGARSPSAGSACVWRIRRAARPAEAARPRRRRLRSACTGARTSTGSLPPHGTGRCPSPPRVGAVPRGRRGPAEPRRVVRHRSLPADRAHAGRGRRGALGRDGPGLLTADGFQAVRALLGGRGRLARGGSFPGRTGSALRLAGQSRAGLPRPGRSPPAGAAGRLGRPVVAARDDGLPGGARCRTRGRRMPASIPTSWPRRSPASCSPVGAWSSATSSGVSRSRSRGGTCSGRCAGWRRAAWCRGGVSWPASPASSSRCPKPPSSCAPWPSARWTGSSSSCQRQIRLI